MTRQPKTEEFYQHLDKCQQCEKHPFDLCPVGQKLIVESAKEGETLASLLWGLKDDR